MTLALSTAIVDFHKGRQEKEKDIYKESILQQEKDIYKERKI